jgi:hypothetical protein
MGGRAVMCALAWKKSDGLVIEEEQSQQLAGGIKECAKLTQIGQLRES